MRSLLFITRKWEGFGGMQQLSRDLWRGMCEMYEGRSDFCAPIRRLPLIRFSVFILRTVFLGTGAVVRRSHVHLGDATLTPLGWFFKKCGCPVTVTVCGLDVLWQSQWYQWLLRRTLPSMDRVVCISHATAEEVQKRGVAQEKIVIIPCGVWDSEKKCRSFETPRRCHGEGFCKAKLSRTITGGAPPDGTFFQNPILLTVGRLVPRKGIVWFLQEVMPRLLEWKPGLQYWIIGEGPEEERICMTIAQMGIGKNAHLMKGVGDQELKERLDACSALLVPNIPINGDMEGFGIVCIEASVRGIPVIAARLEGLRDAVIEGETGDFFTPLDAGDCIRALRNVIEGKSLAHDVVARNTHEHFGWPFLFQRYLHEVFIF